MTQTIAMNGTKPDINPLYIKLRRRFSYQGDRTIGEIKAQEAIRDGYQPYATPAKRSASTTKNASECHVTRANSLPTDLRTRQNVRRSTLSTGTMIILALCAALFLFLLFSGFHISKLNRELSDLNNYATELRVEDGSLSLAIADVEDFAAEGACKDGETTVKNGTSNLLRAFSEK